MSLLNPAPRFSLLNVTAKKTNAQVAAEIPTPAGLLTQKEEAKVNEIVAAVLTRGQEIDSEMEQARLNDDGGAQYVEDQEEVLYESEKTQGTRVSTNGFNLPSRFESGLAPSDIVLDPSQLAAVKELATHQYGCLIGAAGTGKTTVQKFLLQELIYGTDSRGGNIVEVKRLAGAQGLSIALVAFTGMAAQVIKFNQPDWIGVACKTIHGLLEYKPEESINNRGEKTRIFLPSRHNMNKCDHNVVIIDEASMVGLDLWKNLLSALKPGTRVYMTGDLNQLPPIIGQPVFAYALSKWPVCELTVVHRQKEKGANRIIEVAHQVLNGQQITFDSTKDNPDWRVAGFKLDGNPKAAQQQILAILNQVRGRRINIEDPDSAIIYDPYRDRVMTAGNGFLGDSESDMVQQAPLNEALSILIQPPKEGHQRYIIDAGRRQPKFGVGLRVMATKNEAPDIVDRVTNGMTGVITDIHPNPKYVGDRKLFGLEDDVIAETRVRIANIKLGSVGTAKIRTLDALAALDDSALDVDEDDDARLNHDEEEASEAAGGLASHSVTIRFDNGATRTFSSKASVESLHLAYCSTVAKCQGSQFDTAIIIVHHAQKMQLSREWLYTAITRATKRVIILYTDFGLRYAVSKQKIYGKTIAEKVEAYRKMAAEGKQVAPGVKLRINVPLTIEEYDETERTFEYIR